MKKYKEHSYNEETNQELPTNNEALSDDTSQLKEIEAKFESKYKTMVAEYEVQFSHMAETYEKKIERISQENTDTVDCFLQKIRSMITVSFR